jgi:abortive infection bacteriophage resistance protein
MDITLDNGRVYTMETSVFDHLLTIKLLHRGEWGQEFSDSIEKLFSEYSDVVEPQVLGFPDDWKSFFV